MCWPSIVLAGSYILPFSLLSTVIRRGSHLQPPRIHARVDQKFSATSADEGMLRDVTAGRLPGNMINRERLTLQDVERSNRKRYK